jgi:hypothetical protein
VGVKFDGATNVGAAVVAVAVLEYPLKFVPSVARTRYVYAVEPSKPVSLKVSVAVVPTCVKLPHAPEQRSIKYWVMVPPVSDPAVQERLICTGPEAVAVRFDGATNVGAAVVAVAVFEYGPVLLFVSIARTR